MSQLAQVAESVARKYALLRPHLDVRQRRLVLGLEAHELGRGGIKAIALATGVHPDTIARGVREVAGEIEVTPRVRAAGGGRKKLTLTNPAVVEDLRSLVAPETRGDPMSLLVWTTKSTRKLAAALGVMGHQVSDRTVAAMLGEMGFSLQRNAKVTEGRQHEDRDAQFGYLNTMVAEHAGAGQPVVSVDTKKKELVGNFKNNGREYQPLRRPGAARRPRPGPPGRRPHQRDQRARPVRVLQPRQTSGRLAPGSDQDDDTRWRPPPLPATPTDPEPPQPGQQHLHWPRQARPRVRRPPPVSRLSDAGVGGGG